MPETPDCGKRVEPAVEPAAERRAEPRRLTLAADGAEELRVFYDYRKQKGWLLSGGELGVIGACQD